MSSWAQNIMSLFFLLLLLNSFNHCIIECKSSITPSVGTDERNVKKLDWASSVFSLSNCNPEIQRADSWSMTMSSAVSPVPGNRPDLLSFAVIRGFKRRVYAPHPRVGGEREVTACCLCLRLQIQPHNDCLASAQKLSRYVIDFMAEELGKWEREDGREDERPPKSVNSSECFHWSSSGPGVPTAVAPVIVSFDEISKAIHKTVILCEPPVEHERSEPSYGSTCSAGVTQKTAWSSALHVVHNVPDGRTGRMDGHFMNPPWWNCQHWNVLGMISQAILVNSL